MMFTARQADDLIPAVVLHEDVGDIVIGIVAGEFLDGGLSREVKEWTNPGTGLPVALLLRLRIRTPRLSTMSNVTVLNAVEVAGTRNETLG